MTKTSPCCKAPIVRKGRFGGQVKLDYCKKCKRRVWGGNKLVTREMSYQINGEIMARIARKKPERQDKFFDIFVKRVTEEYEGR